jgi:hypothetical protein
VPTAASLRRPDKLKLRDIAEASLGLAVQANSDRRINAEVFNDAKIAITVGPQGAQVTVRLG